MLKQKLLKLVSTLMLGLLLALALTLFRGADKIVLGDNQVNGDTITPTQTISGTWSGTLTATTDITITSGVVITITSGTVIQIEDSDSAGAGVDPARIEFIVQSGGELRVNGPVTFTSKSATPAPADWYGIRFESGSSGWVDGAVIEYGVHGLALNTANPVTVTNSTIRYNLHAPAANTLAFGAGLHIVQGNHFIQNTRIYSNTADATGTGQVRGGGIYIQGGSPHILNSWIYENTARGNRAGAGGGIGVLGGGALIESSYILTNTMTGGGNNQLKSGGGIGIAAATSAIISDSLIAANRNNLTDGYAGGGGIGFGAGGTAALIEDNVIHANYIQGPDWCEGGGIDTWDTSNAAIIRNNLIISNTSGACRAGQGAYGGGINMNGSAAVGLHVINNTIVGNVAGRGGGLYLQGGNVTARNNIVANNTAIIANQAGGIQRGAGTADYNDIFGNSAPQTVGTIGANTIYVDPLFVGSGDLATFYHIQQGSPAIDAGTNTGAGLPSDDYDGDSRPGYVTWDIGFDEIPAPAGPFAALKYAAPDSSPGFFAAGEEINYTISISNTSGSAASGRITDVLPLNTTYSGGPTCNPGVCGYDSGSNTITWTGSLPAGNLLILGYSVDADAPLPDGTAITNTAAISMGSQLIDTNIVTTTIRNPAFSVSKARVGGAPVRGVNFDFRITLRNSSLGGATDIVVTDTLPVGATFAGGGGSLSDNNVTWNITSLAPGSSRLLTLRVWTCQSNLTNQYYQVVTSTQGVASAPGASASTALALPSLIASFNYDPFVLQSETAVNVGTTIHFTNTSATNGRPITDWDWDFGDGITDTGTTVSHLYDTPGVYIASLTVTDECGFTNTETATITAQAPAVTVAKTAEPWPGVEAGDVLTYTIVVSNAGSGYASGLTISDTIPTGATYIPGSSLVTIPVLTRATYRDEWRNVAYNGSDGTEDWSVQPWLEIGETNGPNVDNARVVLDQGDRSLRIQRANRGIRRQADLSGYTSATLDFEYRRQGFDNDPNDYVTLSLSNDGLAWTPVLTFAGPGNDVDYVPVSLDISNYIATSTTIRFLSAGTLDAGDYFFVDNVHIEARDEQMTVKAGGAPPTLLSGETLNAARRMTITYAITVASPWSDPDSTITNTASVTTTQVSTPTAGSVTNTVTTSPAITVTKDGPTSANVDDTVIFTFTVGNIGNSLVKPVEVEDDYAGAGDFVNGDDNSNGWLESGESWVYTASYTIQPTDQDPLTNTVMVTATDVLSVEAAISNTHSLDIEYTPLLTIAKDGPPTSMIGAAVIYTFTVEHDAASDGSPVYTVTVSDDVAGSADYVSGDTDANDQLDDGETWVYTASYTIQPTDSDPLVNTGVVAGKDGDGDALGANDTHSTLLGYTPVLSIAKDGPAAASVGDTVVYTFSVEHDAASDNSPVLTLTVTDDLAGAANYVGGDTNSNDELDGGETWVYTASYTIQPTDPNLLENTATVEGKDKDGADVSANSNTHSLDIEFTPLLTITKDGPLTAMIGAAVIYTFTVEHDAVSDSSPVYTVSVSDDVAGAANYVSGDSNANDELDGGETWVYTASYTIQVGDPDPLVNIAAVTGQDGDDDVVAANSAPHSLVLMYTLDIAVEGMGGVTKDPDRATYLYGDVVTLTASAATGWTFDSWLDPLNGSGLIPILTNPMTNSYLHRRCVHAGHQHRR